MFRQDFQHDFDAIMEAEEPLALVRFHDGEYALLEKMPYRAASKWTSPGGQVWLYDSLLASLVESDLDRYFIGISPPCCTPGATQYYRQQVRAPKDHLTFATLFTHRNYRRFGELRARFSDAVTVGCKQADIQVPFNGVTRAWDIDAVVKQLLEVDRPILIAAGPCANVIIHRYWKLQAKDKRQYILDVGAAMDLEIHGEKTRHYHAAGSRAQQHRCSWTDSVPGAPVSRRARRRAENAEKSHKAMEQMQGTPAFVSGKPGRGSSRKVKRR